MSLQHNLPFTDILVQYSPRWTDAGVLGILLCVAAVVVPLLLIVMLARYESRLVPGLTAVRLVGFRLVVLFLILFLVLCQPSVAWPQRDKPRELIVIAVDRSGSMSVSDPQRPPELKLKVALALRLARDLASDMELEEWAEQLAAGKPIRWAGDDDYAGDSAGRRQLERKRRDAFDDVCKRVDALSRANAAKAILADSGLIDGLAEKFDIEFVAFDRTAQGFSKEDWNRIFDKQGDAHAADFTNISLPLSRADERDSNERRVRAVILMTDGQHNPGPGAAKVLPGDIAKRLADNNIPIFPIGLRVRNAQGGKPSAPPPLSITPPPRAD